MDRKWINANRLSDEYKLGMKEFIAFAIKYAVDPSKIICPCETCHRRTRVSVKELREHLTCNGFESSYTRWYMHCETDENERMKEMTRGIPSESSETNVVEDCDVDNSVIPEDHIEELIEVVEEGCRDCPEMFNNLKSDAETPLYEGCNTFTKLSGTLTLYKIKASNGWSDKSFTELLASLKKMFPKENALPCKTYEAKQMLRSIGMSCERIHACPNDCVLFRNEKAELNECPECSAPRYKKGNSPAKVLWYFPVIPRFRRLFSNPKDAKHLTWHHDERIKDGKLRHPADSPQWKNFDDTFPEFGWDPRNLRLALSTDGMNPHGVQSSSHSTWPVILIIYNLLPWLCIKRRYMMLTMLISGPKQPGNNRESTWRVTLWDMIEFFILDYIGQQEIVTLILMQKLDDTHIAAFISYLYKTTVALQRQIYRYGFLCPTRISPGSKISFEERARYVADVLVSHSQKLILSPLNIGDHWILVVVDPCAMKCYYLDSLFEEIPDFVTQLYSQALMIFRARSPTPSSKMIESAKKVTWSTIQCPKQQDSIQCGYYVMKFMWDIIKGKHRHIPNAYFTNNAKETGSSEAEIDEVRGRWSSHVHLNA